MIHYKRPVSVLVLIYTPDLQVLLLERAARGSFGPALISNARNQALPGVRSSTQVLDWIATTHGVNCLP